MKIKSITKIDRNREDVYNLEIEDNHNYFVEDILVSNCHQIKQGNEITNFIKKQDTSIIYGFTGTVPDDVRDRWSVIGNIGPLIYSEKAYTFQDKETGILASLDIVAIKFKHSVPQPYDPEVKNGFAVECDYIENSKTCTYNIAKIAHKLRHNTIVMFDHTLHGQSIFKMIEDMNENFDKQCFFINGETELDIREDIRKYMESADNVILVANTACFSVGINVKNIHNIVFASFGKAKTKVIQSIGRSLRKLTSKDKATLIDIYHDFEYSQDHFKERRELYKLNYNKDIDKHYEIKI